MELLLVRHGQSTWNEVGRWQGQADPPLTDLGRRQAAAAADSIGTVDVIVASTLDRAMSTALIIASRLGVDEVRPEPDLVERHAGEWQGLTRADIEAAYPRYLSEQRRPPGYEGDEQLADRTSAAFDRIASDYNGAEHVLVLTHGGVVYCHEQLRGRPFERLPNLGGCWLSGGLGGWDLGPRVHLVEGDLVEQRHDSIL